MIARPNSLSVPRDRCGADGTSRRAAKAVARAGWAPVLACLAASGSAASAPAPDEALAETLGRVIVSSPHLDPSARETLAQAVVDAARPLPSRPPDEVVRLGEDLTAVISCRHWPFAVPGRESDPDGRAWLASALAHVVAKTGSLRLPDATELAAARSMPERIVSVIGSFGEKAHRTRSREIRSAIVNEARRELRRLAPLFGNAFVPQLLHACDGAADGDLRSKLLEGLTQSAQLELPMLTDDEDPEAEGEWATFEARKQVATAMSALSALLAECGGGKASDEGPPASLVEWDKALLARAREDAERGSIVRVEGVEDSSTTDEPASTPPASVDASKSAPELSHAEAMSRAFEGSGIVVIHGTAVLPRSWSARGPGARADWRRPERANRGVERGPNRADERGPKPGTPE